MSEPAVIAADAYLLRFEDWLRLPEDNRFYEILGGELVVSPPPATQHQRIVRDLTLELHHFVEEGGLGEVLFAPVGVKLSDRDVVEPDIVVVLAESPARIGTQVIEGPPDLVVEVLSPGTAQRDLGPKREIYQRTGVREYWVVDPREGRIEVLQAVEGRFHRSGLFSAGEALTSPLLPGFELPLARIFALR